MMKLYAEHSPQKVEPKNETIEFLLNFSKSFRVLKIQDENVELFLN